MSQFVVGPEAGDEDTGPVTIYDIQEAERSKVRVRALPRLIRQAVHIAWAAGRSEFVVSTLLQIIGGGGIALLLLLGEQGLQALLDAMQGGQSLAAIAPWAIAIACIAESSHLSPNAARTQESSATMQRHVLRGVLEFSTAVEPSVERRPFHRAQRIQLRTAIAERRLRSVRPDPSRHWSRRRAGDPHNDRATPGTHGVDRLSSGMDIGVATR